MANSDSGCVVPYTYIMIQITSLRGLSPIFNHLLYSEAICYVSSVAAQVGNEHFKLMLAFQAPTAHDCNLASALAKSIDKQALSTATGFSWAPHLRKRIRIFSTQKTNEWVWFHALLHLLLYKNRENKLHTNQNSSVLYKEKR